MIYKRLKCPFCISYTIPYHQIKSKASIKLKTWLAFRILCREKLLLICLISCRMRLFFPTYANDFNFGLVSQVCQFQFRWMNSQFPCEFVFHMFGLKTVAKWKVIVTSLGESSLKKLSTVSLIFIHGVGGGRMLAFVSPPSHFKLFFSHFPTSTHHSAIIIRSLSFDIYTKSPFQDFVFFFILFLVWKKIHLLHSQKNFSHTLWSAFISQRFRNYFRNENVLQRTISAEKCPCDDCTCTLYVYVYSRKNFLFDYTWFFEYFNATCQSRIKWNFVWALVGPLPPTPSLAQTKSISRRIQAKVE